jgi:hypothetical protein
LKYSLKSSPEAVFRCLQEEGKVIFAFLKPVEGVKQGNANDHQRVPEDFANQKAQMLLGNEMLILSQLQHEGNQIGAFVDDLISTAVKLTFLKIILNMPYPLFR